MTMPLDESLHLSFGASKFKDLCFGPLAAILVAEGLADSLLSQLSGDSMAQRSTNYMMSVALFILGRSQVVVLAVVLKFSTLKPEVNCS